ncbi:DUF6223 family protein [Streptomyces sp. BH097]|uniref:DUF6223 family protein n=1 Tax=unclassified Streptomyces TaxID=2593676 RepID=UPI003BB4B31B
MSGLLSMAAEVDSTTLTADRVWATSAALLGLVGLVVAGLALVRADRRYAVGAQAAGLVAVVIGVLNLALADGGPGTGNGVVGGAVALVLGVAAAAVGRLARRRAGRDGVARHQPVR